MNVVKIEQEAQLPQRNSASAAHVYLGWLTDRAMHTEHRRIADLQLDYSLQGGPKNGATLQYSF